MLDHVLTVARVGGEHGDAAAILEAIAAARFDHVAMVDIEGNHLDAAILVDDALAVEFGDVGRDAG